MSRRRLGVLISGRGSNLQSLIDACAAADFPAEVCLVVSNRPDALGLERAKAVGIATAIVDHKNFATRESFEEMLTQTLDNADVELVCLAGFMRILTPLFVNYWRDRLVNIHPSLLPSFKGVDTHERALKAGVKLHGCSVHYVRAEMDDGPIVGQAAVPVFANDDPAILGARVLKAEHQLYPACVRAICEGRVRLVDEVCLIDTPQSDASRLINPSFSEA